MAKVSVKVLSMGLFGVTKDGRPVEKYRLENSRGTYIEVITYGGTIIRWVTPDRQSHFNNIVLSYNTMEAYEHGTAYFGALIGRYANRIARSQFTLDDITYRVTANEGKNQLHGGAVGFDKVIWNAEVITHKGQEALKLTYTSRDGEEGFPGQLHVTVIYSLDEADTFSVDYSATTDKKTVINLTQHAYFNLSGDFSNTILDHEVQINAERYLPVRDNLIPLGELAPVADTPFDFQTPKTVGRDLHDADAQLQICQGYDHCWVLHHPKNELGFAAAAYHAASGRLLEVYTTAPGIQFYTGNALDAQYNSETNRPFQKWAGFCLETQHYPDAPNQPLFPSVVLEVGKVYQSTTRFQMSVR